MKIRTNKSNLNKALSIAARAVATKSVQQLLKCIVLKADKSIRAIANNLELGVTAVMAGEIDEPGEIAVDAKTLLNIVNRLPEDDVIMTASDGKLGIKCGKTKFNIECLSSEEYPAFPEMEYNNKIELRTGFLGDIANQVAFAAAENPSNKVMSGIHIKIEGGKLTATALDGYRVAVRNIEIGDSKDLMALIPAKSLVEIAKIMGDDIVDVYMTSTYVSFESDTVTAFSRLLSGDFFDVDKVLNQGAGSKVVINKSELVGCLERSCILTREGDKKPVVAAINETTMNIGIKSMLGEMSEDIDILATDIDMRVGFNPRYLSEILKVIDSDVIDMYFFGPKSPIIIKDEAETYIYLVLPVNIAG